MTNETLRDVPEGALIREILERAATSGSDQSDAYKVLLTTARVAVQQFVELATERGFLLDAIGEDDQGRDLGFWVIRSPQSSGSQDRYGGGRLINSKNAGTVMTCDYLHVVATEASDLTIVETSTYNRGKVSLSGGRLYDPSYALGAIFNISALQASKALCATVAGEIVNDVANMTQRVASSAR